METVLNWKWSFRRPTRLSSASRSVARREAKKRRLVYYDTAEQKLKIDTNKSSLQQGAKTMEGGPLKLAAGEPLKLRVFVDKSVVEVFANGRQAVMRRVYPSLPKSTGVVLFCAVARHAVKGLKAWDMMPSNPY